MRARVVIIKDNKILLMHRYSKGREYYVIPGGGIEGNETPEDAAIREAKEETGLDIELGRRLWILEEPAQKEKHHYFLVTQFTGSLKLGGPEAKRNSEKDKYILEWHDLKEISELTIFPEEVKEKLAKFLFSLRVAR